MSLQDSVSPAGHRAGFQGWKPSAFKIWSQKYLDFLGPCKTHDLASSRPAQNEEEEAPASRSPLGGIVMGLAGRIMLLRVDFSSL